MGRRAGIVAPRRRPQPQPHQLKASKSAPQPPKPRSPLLLSPSNYPPGPLSSPQRAILRPSLQSPGLPSLPALGSLPHLATPCSVFPIILTEEPPHHHHPGQRFRPRTGVGQGGGRGAPPPLSGAAALRLGAGVHALAACSPRQQAPTSFA